MRHPDLERHFHILGDVNFAAGGGAGAVTAKADEIHFHGERQGPHQVGHKDEDAFQDPHHHQVPAGIIPADPFAQLRHPPGNLGSRKKTTLLGTHDFLPLALKIKKRQGLSNLKPEAPGQVPGGWHEAARPAQGSCRYGALSGKRLASPEKLRGIPQTDSPGGSLRGHHRLDGTRPIARLFSTD